jgi:hypothetical protein
MLVPMKRDTANTGTPARRAKVAYGHLANDSREHAVTLLDALAFERAVDAAWTSSRTPLKPVRKANLGSRVHRPRRPMDARWTPRLVSVASPGDERNY